MDTSSPAIGLASPPRRIWRSIWAIFAGLLANFILSMGVDVILHATGIYPPWFQPMSDPLWILALSYRAVFAVVGGFLTALLAPGNPMKHVMILLAIGLILGFLAAIGNWSKGPEFGPHWFTLGIVAISIPTTWLGGWLYQRRDLRSAHAHAPAHT